MLIYEIYFYQQKILLIASLISFSVFLQHLSQLLFLLLSIPFFCFAFVSFLLSSLSFYKLAPFFRYIMTTDLLCLSVSVGVNRVLVFLFIILTNLFRFKSFSFTFLFWFIVLIDDIFELLFVN